MIKWFTDLAGISKVYFVIAIIFTILLIIQVILLLIGLGHGADFDGDMGVDGDVGDIGTGDSINDGGILDIAGLRMFTIRGFIVFFSLGSWFGLLLQETTGITWLSVIIAVLTGLIAMFLYALAMKKMSSFERDGTINYKNAINKEGTVYLTIPRSRSGAGKVNVVVQDSLIEAEAVTDSEENIPSGADIVVVEVVGNKLLVKRR